MSIAVVILTGAGISAESGIRTFRNSDGLWENHRIDDVATPEGFDRDPEAVHSFYNQRRRQLCDPAIKPNKAHEALAQLELDLSDNLVIITQNIDNLHERAGSKNVIHMHGELLKRRCTQCNTISDIQVDMYCQDICSECNSSTLRPHIVWFGEMPLEMERIYQLLENCQIFGAIGTSGQVYPAAGFALVAQAAQAKTYQLNLEPTRADGFDYNMYGKATEIVSAWIETIKQELVHG